MISRQQKMMFLFRVAILCTGVNICEILCLVLCAILGNQIEIIWNVVTKLSKPLRETRMVSMKNERLREKIIALSNMRKEKIIVWQIVGLPALQTRLDSLTFKILTYSKIFCIICHIGKLESFKERIQVLNIFTLSHQ